MSQLTGRPKGQRTRLTERLTPDRWRVLAVLRDRSAPVPVRELAAALAASPDEDRTADVVQCRLRHVDLPKLAAAELVVWDESEGTVEPADHPALEDERCRRAIGAPDSWDPTVRAGASERRRTTLALVESGNGSTDRTTLAYEVAICEQGGEVCSEAVDDVAAALHHVHLPKLDHAGLLEYEADDGTVTPAA